jgi:hypothetical protein
MDFGINFKPVVQLITGILERISWFDPWAFLPNAGVTCVGAQAPGVLLGKLIITLVSPCSHVSFCMPIL